MPLNTVQNTIVDIKKIKIILNKKTVYVSLLLSWMDCLLV